jgi:hypothetical protein
MVKVIQQFPRLTPTIKINKVHIVMLQWLQLMLVEW